MPDKKLKDLKQKRNQIASDMRTLHDSIGETREWTVEERKQWDDAHGQLKNLDNQIEREEELRSIEQRYVEDNQDKLKEQSAESEKDDAPIEVRAAAAFDKFMRHGAAELNQEERQALIEMQKRAQAAGVNEKGGYTVPKEFVAKIYEKMKAFGGVALICQLLETDKGNEIAWPTSDGTEDEGELVGENTAATEEDVEFGSESVGAKKISSKIIRVSNELLNDSGVDIERFLAGRIAKRIGRTEAKLLIKGTGKASAAGKPVQPKGLEVSAKLGATTAAADKLVWTEVNKLIHSVDPAYRVSPNTRLLFNDATLEVLENMVDTQGRPIWIPSLIGGAPATILKYQYQIDQGVDNLAAGNKFMFFGDFDQLILRRVRYMILKRLVERFAEFDQTGFLAFHRMDCVLQDSDAIKSLQAKGTASGG